MRRGLLLFALLEIFATPSFGEILVPQGYELQILEPTGGKIARPKGWFYTEQYQASGYTWKLSKEDPKNRGL